MSARRLTVALFGGKGRRVELSDGFGALVVFEAANGAGQARVSVRGQPYELDEGDACRLAGALEGLFLVLDHAARPKGGAA